MTLNTVGGDPWDRRKRSISLVLVLASLPGAFVLIPSLRAQSIHTVAGGGPNDIAATSANLVQPSGVAIDSLNNLYVVSPNQNRVFKVGASGVMTVVAGRGTMGFSGDAGRASDAELYNPQGIALDASGNLYIADTVNERIRVVNMQPAPIKVAGVNIQPGCIATIAGNGAYEFSVPGAADDYIPQHLAPNLVRKA